MTTHEGVHRLVEGTTGRVIVVCHPTPGAGSLDPGPSDTWKRGVTLLGVDRPGYGRAPPVGPDSWATVGGAADTLASLLSAKHSGPVGVVGWGAGGRVALALGARHPDLVDRIAVVATPAPDREVPWIPAEFRRALAEMADESASVAVGRLESLLRPATMESRSLDRLRTLLHSSPADRPVLAKRETREALEQMLDAALAQGTRGYAADVAGFCLRPWGFDPKDVQAKTLLLYGARDPVCASAHGRWWQGHLPNARLEMSPGAGHLLVFPRWSRILSHLAPGAERSGLGERSQEDGQRNRAKRQVTHAPESGALRSART